jgi:metal-responsive CopG/Arc/MetJ family transcriptional regulator
MKTAISLPDALYAEGEAYAECHHLTRSRLYAAALREYLLRHNDDAITAAIDALVATHPDLNRQDLDLAEASRRALLRDEW